MTVSTGKISIHKYLHIPSTPPVAKEAVKTPAFHQVPPTVQKLVPVLIFNATFPARVAACV